MAQRFIATAVTFLTIAFLTGTASAQKVDIQFDYSNAGDTLAAFAQTDTTGIDHLIALPATKAVIAKRATRDPKVNAAVYKDSLLRVRAGEKVKDDPFQWQLCLGEQKRGSLRPYLKQRPTAFTRDYIQLCTTANNCSHPISPEAAVEILDIDKQLSKAGPPTG
jgi:hypothetical protein